MLFLDPRKRCSCTEALNMDYFKNKPYPARGSQLPLPEGVRESLGISNPSQNPQVCSNDSVIML